MSFFKKRFPKKKVPRNAPSKKDGAERGAPVFKRFSVHPLFFLVGILSAFTGGLFHFLSACFAAIEHECAHAFAARRYGFRLDRIVLMPYGAVISGDVTGLTPKEEFFVAAAGPLVNALTALAFAALWWFFPDTYHFTEAAANVSFSLFLVNLFPAYPLDGGRILGIALRPFCKKRTGLVLKCVTFFVSAAILGYFVYSCFSKPNFSALVFACLLFAGAFGKAKYSKLRFSHKKSFSRGIEEKRIAISSARPIKEGLRFLREDRYIVFVLYDGEEFLGELSETEYLSALETHEYSAPFSICLGDFEKGA